MWSDTAPVVHEQEGEGVFDTHSRTHRYVLKKRHWLTSCLTGAVCSHRGICLPASSINPHFPGLLRFNSHQSIWAQRTQTYTALHARIRNVSSDTDGQLVDTQSDAHTHSLHTFPEHVCTPVAFIGWAAIQPWVQESGLSACSQDSAGVSSAQKRSQGPIKNHSRRTWRTLGQINSKTMYSPRTSSKIFLIT